MENSMAYSISATDDHCYPGTTVLINKLDIRDQEKLNEAELFIVSVKSLQFEMEPFQKIWTLRTTSVFISFYLGNYMTGLVPCAVLILVSNERGFAQQQRFLL